MEKWGGKRERRERESRREVKLRMVGACVGCSGQSGAAPLCLSRRSPRLTLIRWKKREGWGPLIQSRCVEEEEVGQGITLTCIGWPRLGVSSNSRARAAETTTKINLNEKGPRLADALVSSLGPCVFADPLRTSAFNDACRELALGPSVALFKQTFPMDTLRFAPAWMYRSLNPEVHNATRNSVSLFHKAPGAIKSMSTLASHSLKSSRLLGPERWKTVNRGGPFAGMEWFLSEFIGPLLRVGR